MRTHRLRNSQAALETADVQLITEVMEGFERDMEPRFPPANVAYPLSKEQRRFFKIIKSVSEARKNESKYAETARNHLKRDEKALAHLGIQLDG